MRKFSIKMAGSLFGLAVLTGALWLLFHELRRYHYHEIVLAVHHVPTLGILLACCLTALDYFVLTGYDVLAFRYLRRPVSYRLVAPVSFAAFSFSNSLGFSILSGGAIRYRLYSAWGISAAEITRIVAFCAVTFWLGFISAGGLTFVLEPTALSAMLNWPFLSFRILGPALIGLTFAYLALTISRKKPFRIRESEFFLPSIGLGLGQVGLGMLDLFLAASVLYVLLPSDPSLTFFQFAGIFILALFLGVVSQVPGGLGVFETGMVLLLSGRFGAPAVIGSLLAFRAVYYLLPLLTATALIAGYELFSYRKALGTVALRIGGVFSVIVPHFLAAATFLGGAVLLFSGATPSIQGRLDWVCRFLPLPVIEMSHFLSSLAGAGLLILAWGLQRRLDSAYLLSSVFLSLGALWSLLKGFDYEEAVVLLAILAMLLSSRRHFFRKASLLSERFTPGWIVLIGLVIVCSGWLGLFSYKHLEYSSDLWWKFALLGDAPRFLRAGVGVVSLIFLFSLVRLLRPAPVVPGAPSAEDLEKARRIVSESPFTSANLALLGDKSLLFSENSRAFIMYGVEKKSWVALGDPLGPKEEADELAWRFRELCHFHGGWTVFYQVRPENLPLYLDLGLALNKLGEEGRVSLESFSLEGASYKTLRHSLHAVEREGGTFGIIPAKNVSGLLPELKMVSDQWLLEKHTREKRFSLGFFKEDYLSRQPVAVVRRNGTVVAFANLLLTGLQEELSIDLMRYSSQAPKNVMDYLFIKLVLWGQEQGYRWFNLGMAPLSGLEDRSLAPLWSQLGALVFRHGEHFYNFQGIRQYKDKFDPVWEPRYLASPGGFALPQVLTHLASLISGGLIGVVSR